MATSNNSGGIRGILTRFRNQTLAAIQNKTLVSGSDIAICLSDDVDSTWSVVEQVLAGGKYCVRNGKAGSAGGVRDTSMSTPSESNRGAKKLLPAPFKIDDEKDQALLQNQWKKLVNEQNKTIREEGLRVAHISVGLLSNSPQAGIPILLLEVDLTEEQQVLWVKSADAEEDDKSRMFFLNPYLEAQYPTFSVTIVAARKKVEQGFGDATEVIAFLEDLAKKLVDRSKFDLKPRVDLLSFHFRERLMLKELDENFATYERSTLFRKFFGGEPAPAEESSQVPNDIESRVLAPLDADSSQLKAVWCAHSNRDFVLSGPPGGGKSQTIANMMCDLAGNGKSVLFVTEKRAGSEVVINRLRKLGLGGLTVDLFDESPEKAKRAIGEAMKQAGNIAGTHSAQEVLEKQRQERLSGLHLYQQLIHEGGPAVDNRPNRASLFEVLDRSLNFKQHSYSSAQPPNEDVLRHVRLTAKRWAESKTKYGLTKNDLEEIKYGIFEVKSYFEIMEEVRQVPRDRVLPISLIRKEAERADELKKLASTFEGKRMLSGADVEKSATLASEYEALYAECRDMGFDTKEVDYFIGLNAKTRNAVIRSISKFAEERLEVMQDENSLAECFSPVWDWGTEQDRQNFHEELKRACDSTNVDWYTMIAQTRMGQYFGMTSIQSKLRKAALHFVSDEDLMEKMKSIVKMLERRQATFASNAGAINECRKAGLSEFASTIGTPEDDWDVLVRFMSVLQNAGQLLRPRPLDACIQLPKAWKAWNGSHSEDTNSADDVLGLYFNFLEARGNTTDPDGLDSAQEAAMKAVKHEWKKLVLEALKKEMWDALVVTEYNSAKERARGSSNLFASSTTLRDEYIEEFVDLDKRYNKDVVLRKLKEKVRMRQKEAREKYTAQYAVLNSLQQWASATQKTSRPPVRKNVKTIIGENWDAFNRFIPCVVASPVTVAKFLPLDKKFDFVIIDEGSQMRPRSAATSFVRAMHAVVAGDEEQLPPTSAFMKLGHEEDDGDGSSDIPLPRHEDMLHQAASVTNIHSIPLQWHYRSQHEGLIAHSSKHHYSRDGNTLKVIPATSTTLHDGRRIGLWGRYIHGATWEKEKSSGGNVNRVEAEAVVQAVVEVVEEKRKNGNNQSIGVLAFTSAQAQLISRLLQMRGVGEDDVFVNHLEQWQGEERDLVLVSLGYTNGAKFAAFYPSIGGANRLNVAVTRAKEQLIFFYSCESKPVRDSMKELRDYLDTLVRVGDGRAVEWTDVNKPKRNDDDDDVDGSNGSGVVAFVRDKLEKRLAEDEDQQLKSLEVRSHPLADAVVFDPVTRKDILAVVTDRDRDLTVRDRERLRPDLFASRGWAFTRIFTVELIPGNERQLKDRLETIVKKLKDVVKNVRDHLENEVRVEISTSVSPQTAEMEDDEGDKRIRLTHTVEMESEDSDICDDVQPSVKRYRLGPGELN